MSTSAESPSSSEKPASRHSPVPDVAPLISQAFDDMGLGPVTASVAAATAQPAIDFSVVHFIILPGESAWIDLLLEADRASSRVLYERFSGVKEQSDADLEDLLREMMNMIHGPLKVAFKQNGSDVIIPVVPQSVAPNRLVYTPAGSTLHSRHSFHFSGATLRLTMVARVSPVTHKCLHDLGLATVLAEALAPEGSTGELVLLKKGTMLDKRVLGKVRGMTGLGENGRTHPVIEPSPYAKIVSQG